MPVGYQPLDEDGGRRRPIPETVKMRTFCAILASAFLLVGPSMTGSSDAGLPGIGAFAYNGSPIVTSVPRTVLVASR
jgi:hypothetical protein